MEGYFFTAYQSGSNKILLSSKSEGECVAFVVVRRRGATVHKIERENANRLIITFSDSSIFVVERRKVGKFFLYQGKAGKKVFLTEECLKAFDPEAILKDYPTSKIGYFWVMEEAEILREDSSSNPYF